jgi:hypothetical protein
MRIHVVIPRQKPLLAAPTGTASCCVSTAANMEMWFQSGIPRRCAWESGFGGGLGLGGGDDGGHGFLVPCGRPAPVIYREVGPALRLNLSRLGLGDRIRNGAVDHITSVPRSLRKRWAEVRPAEAVT